MLNLHRLHLLRELSLRGTVGDVASALSFSPSTISQQLATLEVEVGAKLLEPVGRRLRLTREGELLVAHAGRVLAAAEEAEAALSAASGAVVGTVRLACFQTAALAVLPDVVRQLRDEHPQLTIQVHEFAPDQMIPALQAHDFDVVLGEEYPGRSLRRHMSIEIEEVATERLCLVVNAAAGKPGTELASLKGADWVMEPRGNAARDWAVEQCRRGGFEPRVTFESADLLVHVKMVESGLAVGFLPDLLWAGSPRVDATRWSLPADGERRIVTATRRGASMDPAIAAVRSALSGGVVRATSLAPATAGAVEW